MEPRRYHCSEDFYQQQKPRPFDDAVWDRKKISVMDRVVRAKLRADPSLARLLRVTGHHEVWGFDPMSCQGQNLLAEIWMKAQAELLAVPPGSTTTS